MSIAALEELGLTPPAAVDEGQAVSVVWRPETVDLTSWPSSGPWSRVRRGVPVLRVPELDRTSYHRLLCIALSRGLINAGEHHLGQWLQDDIGPGGAVAWRHEDMTDYAQHYADWTAPGSAKPRKCSSCTFWRRLRVLRELGLVAHLEAAFRGQPARYEVCLRADSPLLVDMPEDLARTLRVDLLARLLGEREVPTSTEPERGAVLTQIAEVYGGAQLAAEQHADAAAVSLMGKYEVALIHAKTSEEEATISRLALAASRGWADADARPAGDVPPPAQRPTVALQARQELAVPGRPLPAALKADLARLAGIKRAVIRGYELAGLAPATKCKTSPITEMALTPYGLSPGLTYEVGSANDDGRSKAKTKAAPTARTTKPGAGQGPATGGWPVVQNIPEQAPSAPVRAKLAPADVKEGTRVARRVWAIWRDRRPTQTLLGQWVTGPDGLSVWEAGTGWDDLVRLIARCLRRVPESAIIDHAAASASAAVRDPVKVLCGRLWKISRLDAYAYRRDLSRPASYVLAEQDLSGAERGQLERERRAAQFHGVRAEDASAAPELREGQDQLRAQTGQWRQAEAEPLVHAPRRHEWVDDSATPFIPRPSLEQIEADLAALSEPEPWPEVQGVALQEAARQAEREREREAAEARAAIQPAPAAPPRRSSDETRAAAQAKRQADRDAEAVRTPAQQAARAALRQARGK
jgi:hypothetical protein